jgi:hypothetical protein
MADQTITGQTFNEPYPFHDEIRARGGTLVMQPAYSLTEADWAYLKHGEPKVYKYARALMVLGIGTSMQILAKWLATLTSNTNVPIAQWEWYIPPLCLMGSVILGIAGWVAGDHARRVRKAIDEFFEWVRKKQP